MPYVKITGYLEVEDSDLDKDSLLTEEAWVHYIDTDSTHVAVGDLEDLRIIKDDRKGGQTNG